MTTDVKRVRAFKWVVTVTTPNLMYTFTGMTKKRALRKAHDLLGSI